MADYYQLKNQNIFNPPANTSLGNSTNQFGNAFVQNDLVLGNVTVTGATINTPKVNTIGYPGDDTAADTAGGQTITLTGSGFLAGASVLINGSAVGVVSVVSSTTITFTSPANSTGSYVLYVINTDGGTAILIPGIQYSGVPTWTTAAGSLGNVYETASFNQSVTATGDVPITYSLFSGSIPPGATFNSNGTITGTSELLSSSTTYTFTVRATDAEAQDTNRSFSLTINPDVVTWSSPANGTTYTSTANSAISNVTLVATSAVGSGITYTANALPVGLSLTGANISGTPTVEANSSSLLTATANTTSESSSITINWVIGVANDIFFEYNTLLIPGASTTFVDDASTNNFAATITGDPRPNSFSPYTPGYYSNYFDGNGDYLSAPSNSAFAFGTGNFTLECWIYVSSPSDTPIYEGRVDGNSTLGFTLTAFSSTVIRIFCGSILISATVANYTNQWTHVAVVKNSGTTTLYVNGVSGGTTASLGNLTDTQPLIGAGRYTSSSSPSAYMNGYVSNFRIVKGTAVYTGAFTPSTTPLTAIANTSLLTCQSNRFIDNSTNNFTITVAGNTTVRSFNPFVPNASYSTYGSTYLNGSAAYINIPNNAAFAFGTGDFTIEFWVNTTDPAGGLVSQGVTGGWATTFYSNTVYWQSSWNQVNLWTSPASSITNGVWHHLAFSRASGSTKFFIDGVLAATNADTTNYSVTSGSLIIGRDGNPTDLEGYISDLRVVKGTAVYTTAFTPPSAPLTAIANTSLLTLQNNQSVNNNVFLDNSTNNFFVTRNGNTTQGTFSPYGGNWSNYFNGSTDGYSIANNAAFNLSTGAFTIECWVFPTAMTTYHTVLSNRSAVWEIGLVSNTFYWYVGSTVYSTTISVPTNQWTHVASSSDGTNVKLFVNGVLDRTITGATPGGTSSTLYIANAANSQWFPGYISNLRIVKGTALYTSNFTPSTTPLTVVSGTSLLTCADNRVIDDSINNFTITKISNASVQRFSPFNPSSVTPTSYSGYFDGDGDYLLLATSPATNITTGSFTIECWVNVPSIIADMYLFGTTNSVTGRLVGRIASSTTVTIQDNGGTTTFTVPTIVLNTWNHIVWVRSGSSTTVFVNGVRSSTGAVTNTTSYTQIVQIGAHLTNYFTGYISNFRIVVGTAVYDPTQSTITVPTSPLTAISGTSLLTLQSPTFIDNSTNNFTISAFGNSQPTQQNPFGFTSATTNGYTVSTIGGSAYFDGTGDYLTFPNNAVFAFGTGSYTIEFWINGPLAADKFILSGRGAIGTMHITTGGTGSAAGTLRYVGTSTIASSNVVMDNTWHHCAIVRNGSSNITLYVDGISVATGTDTTNYTSTSGTWYIASNDISVPSNVLTGYISNLRIVRGTAVYTSNFVPPSAPLTAVQNTVLLTNMTSAGIYDASMMNNMETVGDAKLSTAVSKFGGSSMSFDGTGDYLTMPNSPNLNLGSGDFTIEAWIYLNSMVESSAVVSKGSNGQFLIFIGGNNELSFYASTTGSGWTINDLRIATSPSLSTWHHIAVTRAGSTVKTFFNGITANSTTLSGSLVSQSTPVLVGYYTASFNGYIDDLRITKGVARYTSNFTPATSAFPIF